MDEFRARRVVDSLRARGVNAHVLRGGYDKFGVQMMTPQQRALVAELRSADYPAAWRLTASASDDKLVMRASEQTRRERQVIA